VGGIFLASPLAFFAISAISSNHCWISCGSLECVGGMMFVMDCKFWMLCLVHQLRSGGKVVSLVACLMR